ncbi:MAG: hypothetical protein ACI9VR_002163 [Cognaticolwellia sp.]|jgi:hypothetical protein
MLLLLTTLVMAQDPAPEGAGENQAVPVEAVEAPAEATAVPAEAPAAAGEASDVPAAAPLDASEAPLDASEAPLDASEAPLEARPVQRTEELVPVAAAPAILGSYEEGYEAGLTAAEEFVDWLQPAVAGAGIGAGAAGMGVVCGGLVCGAPAVLGGAGYQAYKTRKDVPAPPPGAWQKRSAEFQTGFIQGFQARANQKRTRWALAGGATGAVVGVGVGLVVVAVLYDRQGRDFI